MAEGGDGAAIRSAGFAWGRGMVAQDEATGECFAPHRSCAQLFRSAFHPQLCRMRAPWELADCVCHRGAVLVSCADLASARLRELPRLL